MKLSEIKIGNRFRKDLGDIDSLVRSIKEVGLLHPIVVSEKGELIVGFRRLKACESLGWTEIPSTTINLLDLQKGEIEENLVRKDFSVSEMVAIKRALEPEVKETRIGHRLSKEEQEKVSNLGTFPKGATDKIVAEFAGVSHGTLVKAETIVEAAEKEPEKFQNLLKSVDEGKTSIHYAFQVVKREQRHTETPDLPKGTYDIILADPPWEYEFGIRGSTDLYYSTMATQEIINLAIPTAENAILFLWATAPKLREALEVMKAWGFTYKTHMVWVKDKIGNGYYFRGKHELLLLGEKGDLPIPMEEDRPESVLFAPRQEHSHKPVDVYALIERMYPNRKYLELFATQKRGNWEAWGNDIQ